MMTVLQAKTLGNQILSAIKDGTGEQVTEMRRIEIRWSNVGDELTEAGTDVDLSFSDPYLDLRIGTICLNGD